MGIQIQDLRIKTQDSRILTEGLIVKKYHILLLASCLSFLNTISAQQNFPLNREWALNQDKINAGIPSKISKDSIADNVKKVLPSFADIDNSCFKPLIITPSHPVIDKSKNLAYRKYRKESLFIINDTADKFYLTIDPLFNFEAGVDAADTSGEKLYKNTRGLLVRGDINKNFVFESSFLETQSAFPQYIDDYIASTGSANLATAIVPGQGRSKLFRTNGYDYAMASGYISYSPSSFINIQLGHGKHFIGDGYRSLEEGQRVEFSVAQGQKGLQAEDVSVVE